MNDDDIVAPLANDCEDLRRFLIDSALPPVWTLDAATACRLYDEGVAKTRAAWTPPLDGLAVDVTDVPAAGGLAAARRYRPRTDRNGRPTIVWLHGGGWVLGDLEAADAPARTAAVATGCTIASVDYRRAPADLFPAAVVDALACVDWLLADGQSVVVAGDSAGGNLAACVAQLRGGDPGLLGQVLVYPATDPSMTSDSYGQFTEGPFLTRRDMEWFYDQYLGPSGDRDDVRVNVAAGLGEGSAVPAVVLTVGHDPLRDEGIAYAQALRGRGVPVTWIHAPELFHGAFTQSGLLPSSALRVAQVWAAAREMFTSPV